MDPHRRLRVRGRERVLFFTGRDSETVRRRGENVSTCEVEVEILGHGRVKEAAVHGVPSELGEDQIMASFVAVEGVQPDAAGIIGFLQDRLPYYAVPRHWRRVEELPRTGTHRVRKNELQQAGSPRTPSTPSAGGGRPGGPADPFPVRMPVPAPGLPARTAVRHQGTPRLPGSGSCGSVSGDSRILWRSVACFFARQQ